MMKRTVVIPALIALAQVGIAQEAEPVDTTRWFVSEFQGEQVVRLCEVSILGPKAYVRAALIDGNLAALNEVVDADLHELLSVLTLTDGRRLVFHASQALCDKASKQGPAEN